MPRRPILTADGAGGPPRRRAAAQGRGRARAELASTGDRTSSPRAGGNPLTGKPLLGTHASIAGGLHRALERGAELGCAVIQIFCKSNQQWRTPPLSEAELERWRAARATSPVLPALVHASYLINLASPVPDAADRSLRGLVEELLRTARLGIPYLVVHPGSHGGEGEAAGVGRAACLIDRALEQHREVELPRILLENTAGQGSCIGHRFEHLRDILAASRYPERLGVCLDTCHACAAGYALGSDGEWQSTWRSFDTAVGLDALAAFHLNDSRSPAGSRRDRHEHVGCGALGLSVFHRLLNDPRFRGKPMVIETPKDIPAFDRANLALLTSLLETPRVSPRARRLLRELRELTEKTPP